MVERAPEIQQLFIQGALQGESTVNPIFWEVWIRCVQDTVEKDDPRVYLQIIHDYNNFDAFDIIMIFCKNYYEELQLHSHGIKLADCKIYSSENEIDPVLWKAWTHIIQNTFPDKKYFNTQELVVLTKNYLHKIYNIPVQQYSDVFYSKALKECLKEILHAIKPRSYFDQ